MSLAIRLALAAGLAVGGLAHAAADAPAQLDPAGEKLYRSACVVCHASGVANAPLVVYMVAGGALVALGADGLLGRVV
ncbi:cytochrome c5 family protein [Achromobacter xylosoxidans]